MINIAFGLLMDFMLNNIKHLFQSKKEPTISSFGISRKVKEEFFNNLSAMMSSGLSLSEAIEILEEQSTGNFKKILLVVLHSVFSGRSLSSSMSFYPSVFSEFMINTVRAGEVSGNLDDSLNNIAKQVAKELKLISTIKQAMFYPLIILCLSFAMGMGLSLFVLPKITPIFSGLHIDLPLSTRFLIWFSSFVEERAFYIVIFIVIFITFLYWFFRQKWMKPIIHYLFLHTPIIGRITRSKNLAQGSRILGAMLRSGVGIDEALRITQRSVSNYYYRQSLYRVYQKVKQGSPLSDAFSFETNLFSKLSVSLIKIGEKTGNLEEEFFHLADIYERRVDNDSKAISTAVEPILLVLIGLVVGGLAISIISPIYQVTGNVYR